MNFPMESPIFQLFHWLVNTAGVGGIIALFVGAASLLAYSLVLRWIADGAKADESEVYAYPTPALHDDSEE